MAEQISLFASRKKSKKVKYGVGWLRVLVRFVLWVYAIYNLIIGAMFITDATYDDKAEKFRKLSELSEVAQNNFEYGVVCCLLFVLLLVAIYAIATFKKYADGYSIACFVFGVVCAVSYFVVQIKGIALFVSGAINPAVIDVIVGSPLVIINLAFGLIMVAINSAYFVRRKHYFR